MNDVLDKRLMFGYLFHHHIIYQAIPIMLLILRSFFTVRRFEATSQMKTRMRAKMTKRLNTYCYE